MFLFKNVVYVVYKDILDIENLTIPEKVVTCIVGKSGSGKTTLLKLLNKMISCDSGEIFYRGRQIESIDSISLRRRVMMLGQEPLVFDGSIRENLEIAFKFIGKKPAEEVDLKKALDLVGLDKDLDGAADKLSGGEKQRLSVARLILLEPDVFLLDEPSSALDEKTESDLLESLVSYAKREGKSLIIVTHSKAVSDRFGEFLIEIDNGRVIKSMEVRR